VFEKVHDCVHNDNLRTQSMTQDDMTFFPLQVTRVGAGGKRSSDPVDKRRLIDACLQPGTALSGLALTAGASANQLRKWVRLHEQSNAPVREDMAGAWASIVPVVEIDDPTPVLSPARALQPVPEPEPSRISPRSTPSARMSAQLPNGAKFKLETPGHDAELATAMTAASGAC
jgi:transposase